MCLAFEQLATGDRVLVKLGERVPYLAEVIVAINARLLGRAAPGSTNEGAQQTPADAAGAPSAAA